MSVTVNATATADSTANGVTSINHTNLTIAAGSNRALVVSVAWAAGISAPAMTWDTTQTVTQVTGAAAAATNEAAQVWGLVAPNTGNKTLAVSWTGGRDVCVFAEAYDGVDQTGGTTSFAHGAGATGTSTTASTGAITSAVGNMVQASHCLGNVCSAVNNTQLYRDNNPANISGAANRAAGAATVTMTATLTSSEWASAGADIVAAGGGGGNSEYLIPRSRPFPFRPGSPRYQ